MTGFFRRGDDGLERELRAARPRPSDALVNRLEAGVRSQRPSPTKHISFRIAVPVALTAALVGGLAAVGGVGYAASRIESVAADVTHVFVPSKHHKPIVVAGPTSGGDQYQPGYGFGDPNHNHSGPPGLTEKGGVKEAIVANELIVTTSFTIDEQAHLFVSVINKKTGKELVITQTKSKIGNPLKGPQAKNVNYLVLVPRTIPLKLAIPTSVLTAGQTYEIRIIARAPNGEKKTLLIPFKG